MGWVILPAQLEQINQLVAEHHDSLELLWLPGVIQVTIWTDGIAGRYQIDEDGGLVSG